MPSAAPIRFSAAALAFALFLLSTPLAIAQIKPAAAPAQPTSASAIPQPASQAPPAPARQEPKHAQVVFQNGMVSVSADNSSLNQILRQISHDTGMKITGGVADERVFGQYGPSTPAQVLATLLDGTGTNMLLMPREGDTPAQLILTPRVGGPTPPSPSAKVFDEQAERPPQEYGRFNNVAPVERQEPPGGEALAPNAPSNSAPAGDAAQPNSSNGPRTPQQIYEQLQRLRQQQQTQP